MKLLGLIFILKESAYLMNFITDILSEEVIISAKTMQIWRLKPDFEQDRVIVDQMVTRLMLK